MEKKHILIIDDSVEDIQFLMETLKHDYAVTFKTSGKDGLVAAATEPKPDVIYLDVVMPGLSGYDTCEQLKTNDETKDIDIVFISSQDTAEEILAGYDAGASDYLTKPISTTHLLKKLEILLKNQEIQQSLQTERLEIFNTLMHALTSSGELGNILRFLKDSFEVNSVDGLGNLMINALSDGFGLSGCIQIKLADNNYHYYSTTRFTPPIEQELLRRMVDQSRIIERENRLIMNFDDISLLVKNMPIDNAAFCGRARDNLAILLEGGNSKLAHLKIYLKRNELNQSIKEKVLQNLEELFMSIGLSSNQEKTILAIVEEAIDNTSK